MYKSIILPASILAGTIIGAGFFALPYVFHKAGLVTGLFYLLIFGAVFSVIHLMYGEVILKTESSHRFAGYAKIYLGESGKWLAAATSILGMFLVLTVYLVLAARFFHLIYAGTNAWYPVLIFWLLGSIALFGNLKKLAWAEFLFTITILFIIGFVFFYGIGGGEMRPDTLSDFGYFFLPYGAILFALNGRTAIPPVVQYFKNQNLPAESIKKTITWGTMMPAMAYLLFALGILAISPAPSEDAISGLVDRLPYFFTAAMGVLGLIAIWTTYIAIGQDIKKSMEADFAISKILAALGVIILPILLYASGLQNFLKLVSVTGGVFLGLEGIIIVLMWREARKENYQKNLIRKMPSMIPYLLLFIFGLGIILTIAIR